jgi:hypothetical protein
MTTRLSPLSYVYDGRQCLGFILRRGKLGFEAIDRDERSLGIFASEREAANAIFNHAQKMPRTKRGKFGRSDSETHTSNAEASAQDIP